MIVSPGCGVTSISYRTWINREARDPSLLVSCGDGLLRLFRILPDGSVYLKRKFVVPQTSQCIKSAFCPLMSFLQVSGVSIQPPIKGYFCIRVAEYKTMKFLIKGCKIL